MQLGSALTTAEPMSTGGEVANALVCKTSIRRFNSDPVLQLSKKPAAPSLGPPFHVKSIVATDWAYAFFAEAFPAFSALRSSRRWDS